MNSAVGQDAFKFIDSLLTPKEIEENLLTQEMGLSQKKLEELSGVKHLQ